MIYFTFYIIWYILYIIFYILYILYCGLYFKTYIFCTIYPISYMGKHYIVLCCIVLLYCNIYIYIMALLLYHYISLHFLWISPSGFISQYSSVAAFASGNARLSGAKPWAKPSQWCRVRP